MKRSLGLVVSLALVLSVAACGGSSSREARKKSKAAATQKEKRPNAKKPSGEVDENFVVRGGFR